ncbi:S6 family peptidase [Ursidibacter arcticus]
MNIPLPFKYSLIASSILSISAPVYSGMVRGDIDYQYFRDFAENKGSFYVGAQNIPILNKSGKHIGTMLPNVPMIDLSAVDRNSAVSSAVHYQYVTSVAHNAGYGSVSFGHQGNNPDQHTFDYLIVDRNNYNKTDRDKDYHVPRLNKFITEVEPYSTTTGSQAQTYQNRNRYPQAIRVGSGTHMVRNGSQLTELYGAYVFRTGGNTLNLNGNREHWLDTYNDSLTQSVYGPMPTYGVPGDSGSPIFLYDNQQKRWLLAGVVKSYSGNDYLKNIFVLSRSDYIQEKIREDKGAVIENNVHNIIFDWKATENTSQLTSTTIPQKFTVPLANNRITSQDSSTERPSLNHGKHLELNGYRATIRLYNDIDQGAGGLYFNSGVIVEPTQDQTWKGAGVYVHPGKLVNWRVKNPEGDRLSKLGEGILYVDGRGENKGDLSLGQGTVVLAYNADSLGKKQAFNQVGIVSGRGTLKLMSSDQINPNNIYFGFRGGRLDVNGNDLTFKYIQNSDEGAMLVNHNLKNEATITLTNPDILQLKDLKVADRVYPDQHLYEWRYPNNSGKDYFLPKGNTRPYYPTNHQSNNDWEYLGNNLEKAKQIALDRENSKRLTFAFNGYFGEINPNKSNGKLNINFNPEQSNSTLLISGGVALNGEFKVQNGTVVLSGKPTPHAYDHINNKDVVLDNDWINRQFKATNFVVNNKGRLSIGRNVSEVSGNFTVSQSSKLEIGFKQNSTPICQRSEYTGTTTCSVSSLSNNIFNQLPTTNVRGNIQLKDQSQFILGKANLTGNIEGHKGTSISLGSSSQWTLDNNSNIGNLILDQGKIILNNGKSNTYNQLTINGNLSGSGHFYYTANVAEGRGDHVTVNGIAQGNYILSLKNTGKEPNQTSPLSLITLTNSKQTKNNLSILLENGYVDLGAYRYILANQNNDYRLYSPIRDVELSSNINFSPAYLQLQQARKDAEQYINKLNEENKKLTQKKNDLSNYKKEEGNINSQISNIQTTLNNIDKKWYWTYRKKANESAPYRLQLEKATKKLKEIQTLQRKLRNEVNNLSNSVSKSKKESESYNNKLITLENNFKDLKEDIKSKAYIRCLEKQAQGVCELSIDISANNQYDSQKSLDSLIYQIGLIDHLSEEYEKLKNNPATSVNELANLQEKLSQANNDEKEILNTIFNNIDDKTISDYISNLSLNNKKEIAQKLGISRYTNTAISELSSQMMTLYHSQRNIIKEIKNNKSNDWDIWLNNEKTYTTNSSNDYRDYKHSQYISHLGVEKSINQHNSLGLILSNINITNKFSENVDNKGKLVQATLYTKNSLNDNIVFSTNLGFAKSKNSLQADSDKTIIRRNIYSLGFNIISNWDISQWRIKPIIGMNYHHITGTRYTLGDSLVQQKNVNLLQTNMGIDLSREFSIGNLKLRPELSLDYTYTLNNDVYTNINNYRFSQKTDNFLKSQFGVNINYRQWDISTHFGFVKGKQISSHKYASITIGYNW